jgi:hypothetical protein
MSCNSCSNITLPGVQGPQGPAGHDGAPGTDGDGFTGGSYDGGTGIVTFTSNDGLGFSTGDLRGADGTNGILLLGTITSPVEVSDTGYTTANAIGGSPWAVPENTLKDTGDTLRLELTVIPKKTDGEYTSLRINVGSDVVQISGSSPYDIQFQNDVWYRIEVDMIKISDTTLHVSYHSILEAQGLDFYSGNSATSFSGAGYIKSAKSSQTLNVGTNMVSNPFNVSVEMEVTNASYPAKLTHGKLYFLKQL